MTTVDALIDAADGAARIEFHNGLTGLPAIEILQRAIDAANVGQASGRGELGMADVTVTGAVLRGILDGISGGIRSSDCRRKLFGRHTDEPAPAGRGNL